jgi:putative endonuclease
MQSAAHPSTRALRTLLRMRMAEMHGDTLILSSRDSGVSKDIVPEPMGTRFMSAHVYIVKCADGSFYTGTTRAGLEQRMAEHNAGKFDGYTSSRRPVELVFAEEFSQVSDAIAMERRIKGWSRAKKQALIDGDFDRLKALSKPGAKRQASFDTRASHAAQDEDGGNAWRHPHPEQPR